MRPSYIEVQGQLVYTFSLGFGHASLSCLALSCSFLFPPVFLSVHARVNSTYILVAGLCFPLTRMCSDEAVMDEIVWWTLNMSFPISIYKT
jgi:hypothetical protein